MEKYKTTYEVRAWDSSYNNYVMIPKSFPMKELAIIRAQELADASDFVDVEYQVWAVCGYANKSRMIGYVDYDKDSFEYCDW